MDKSISSGMRLEPLHGQISQHPLTHPGSLLSQDIPIRGNLWEKNKAA